MHAGTPIYVYATNAITWTRALCVTQVRSVGGASSAEAQVGLDMHIEVSHARCAAAYAPSPICMHSTDRSIGAPSFICTLSNLHPLQFACIQLIGRSVCTFVCASYSFFYRRRLRLKEACRRLSVWHSVHETIDQRLT